MNFDDARPDPLAIDVPRNSQYSLWRNGIRLGRLIYVRDILEGGQAHGFVGLLLPELPLTDQESVRQTRFDDLPGMPVVHEFPERFRHYDESSGAVMYPRSPSSYLDEDGRGIPEEEVFSVRTDDGPVVPTNLLAIDRFAPEIDASGEESLRDAGFPDGTRLLYEVALMYEWAYPPAIWKEMARELQEKMRAFRGETSPSPPQDQQS